MGTLRSSVRCANIFPEQRDGAFRSAIYLSMVLAMQGGMIASDADDDTSWSANTVYFSHFPFSPFRVAVSIFLSMHLPLNIGSYVESRLENMPKAHVPNLIVCSTAFYLRGDVVHAYQLTPNEYFAQTIQLQPPRQSNRRANIGSGYSERGSPHCACNT